MLNYVKVFIFSLIFMFCFIQCSKSKNEGVDFNKSDKSAVEDSLKNIALTFLKSWEPPYYPKKALDLFSSSSDFVLVIDGIYDNNYNDWASNIDGYMEHDRKNYKEYRHIIKDIRTVVLSPTSGAVTIVYVWDYIENNGKHFKANGSITFVCRQEQDRWKIVHYHGSHDDEQLINSDK